MKNNIDSNFAIAILALIAACIGFAFWLNHSANNIEEVNDLNIVSTPAVIKSSDSSQQNKYQKYTDIENQYSISYPDNYEINGKGASILISPKKSQEDLQNRVPIDGPAFGVFLSVPEERTVNGVTKLFLPRAPSGIETRYIVAENGYEVEDNDAVSSIFWPFTHDNFEVVKYIENGFSRRVNYLIYKDDYLLHIEGEDYEDDLVMSIVESVDLLGVESADTIEADSRISDLVVSNGDLIYTLNHCNDGKKCSVGMFDGETGSNNILIGNLQDMIPMRSHYGGRASLMGYDKDTKILKVLHRSGGHSLLYEVKDIDIRKKSATTIDSAVHEWCGETAIQGVPKCTEKQLLEREKSMSWWRHDNICKTIEGNEALIANMATEVLGSDNREDYFENSILSTCFE